MMELVVSGRLILRKEVHRDVKEELVDTLSRKNLLRDQASQRDMTPPAKKLRSGFIANHERTHRACQFWLT